MAIRFTWVTATYENNNLDMFVCGQPSSKNELMDYTKFLNFISAFDRIDEIIYHCKTWLYGDVEDGIEDADIYIVASLAQRYAVRGSHYFNSVNLVKETEYDIHK